MKAQIYRSSNRRHWTLLYYRPSKTGPVLEAVIEKFLFFDGAIHRLSRIIEQITREQKALKWLNSLTDQFLSCEEYVFIGHLRKTKCFGITKKQYGYLRGICERQPR